MYCARTVDWIRVENPSCLKVICEVFMNLIVIRLGRIFFKDHGYFRLHAFLLHGLAMIRNDSQTCYIIR